jgi:DNA-binding Lrp family transcriptional regulator
MTGQWAAQGFFHRGPAPQPGPADRAADVLVQMPERSDAWIAETAGCYKRTVAKVRRQLEADGVIPRYAPDVRARGQPGARTRQPYQASEAVLFPTPELSEMPEIMAEGLCVGHPDPDLWQSSKGDPARRAQAIALCRQCPALLDCREWSLQLPVREQTAIYGALSAHQRIQLKKARERERQADGAASA